MKVRFYASKPSLVSLLFHLKYSWSLSFKNKQKLTLRFMQRLRMLLNCFTDTQELQALRNGFLWPILVKFLFSADSKLRYSLGDLRGIAHHRVIKSYDVINDFQTSTIFQVKLMENVLLNKDANYIWE